eukprot:gene26859-29527_t
MVPKRRHIIAATPAVNARIGLFARNRRWLLAGGPNAIGHSPSTRPNWNRPPMLKRLYDWTISLAASEAAEWWLGIIAFVE